MQLPDFKQFDAFNTLRERIGTKRFGNFELFNPENHLTGRERSQLDNYGRRIKLYELTLWGDFTWGIKNTRVMLYLADKEDYHLANCLHCQQLQPEAEVWISTRLNGRLPLGANEGNEREVCADCLQLLGYLGFDLTRNRKQAYSQHLLETFSRESFYHHYTLYPVRGITRSRIHSPSILLDNKSKLTKQTEEAKEEIETDNIDIKL